MENEIIHDKEGNRFYTLVEGKEAHLYYTKADNNTLDFTHTYVPVELRGHGIAGKIVKEGLEFAKENNYKIIPTCSYVETYYAEA